MRDRSPLRTAALAVGAVFLLVGIAGFIPGITSRYMDLGLAGRESTARLLGVFQVSVLHNAVHLLYGVAGLLLSTTPMRARNYLFYGGIGYGAIFLYGILINYSSAANFIPLNAADDALHFALAAAMIAASVLLDRGPTWTKVLAEGKADL